MEFMFSNDAGLNTAKDIFLIIYFIRIVMSIQSIFCNHLKLLQCYTERLISSLYQQNPRHPLIDDPKRWSENVRKIQGNTFHEVQFL